MSFRILDYPGNCYYEALNLTLAPGESYDSNCLRYTCNDDLSIEGTGCGLIGLPSDSPCYVRGIDLDLPYPTCCPDVVCP